jgi:hypothetical protein
MNVEDSVVVVVQSLLRLLPDAEHAAIGVLEEGQLADSRYIRLVDHDPPAPTHNLPGLGIDVGLGLHDPSVDASGASGFHQTVVHIGNVANAPVEHLFVKLGDSFRIL